MRAPAVPAPRIRRHAPDSGSLPEALWRAPDPAPAELWIRGEPGAEALLQRLPARGLAIVGTRGPLPRNVDLVSRAVAALRGQDFVIVSGLARGIDAAAHEAALAHGLPTIGVLAGGIDEVFPRSHEGLAARILAAGGLIVSEYGPGESAYASHFLARNRLIAAWTRATWIVEAAARSGALNTAAHALRAGRDIYATPSFPQDLALAGNLGLLDRGQAHAWFGAHSFGATWLELAARTSPVGTRGPGPEGADDAAVLARAVITGAQRGGGIGRMELLDELAGREAWDPGRFHLAVDAACDRGWVCETAGMLRYSLGP